MSIETPLSHLLDVRGSLWPMQVVRPSFLRKLVKLSPSEATKLVATNFLPELYRNMDLTAVN